MKGRGHLAWGFAIWIIFLIIITSEKFSKFDSNKTFAQMFAYMSLPFFIGLILPDSDSEDRKSKIFYTLGAPIAYIVHLLEMPIRLLTKRSRGHRQSLHTLLGIALTSFILTAIVSLIYIFANYFNPLIAFYVFLGLFIGQFVHLVQDITEEDGIKLI